MPAAWVVLFLSRLCLGLFALSVCGSLIGWAQTTQGSILGNITDASGGVMVGTEVTVTSLDRGFTRTTVANPEGYYEVANLEPGNYRVVARLPGFKEFVREEVALESTKKIRIDMVLQVGEVTERVEVSAVTPQVESETGRIADIVDERTLRQVVMGGRGAYNWILQTPGTYFGYGYTINGGRQGSMGSTIDGLNVGEPTSGNQISPMRPDQEMLREIRVDSVNNSAEFGNTGTITQTTQSGTNEFHGQATYNLQNGALNARNTFSPTRPPGLPIHNFFLSGGGPVVLPGLYDGRNKTFFYAHYNGQRSASAAPAVHSVPTEAMRTGNLSALGVVRDPLTGEPFPGGIIPQGRLNANSLRYLERFYPRPTNNSALPTNNFSLNIPNELIDDAWSVRIDQKVSERNTVFGRYWTNRIDFRRPDGNLPPEMFGNQDRVRTVYSTILSDTHIFTPQLTNDFRIGFARFAEPSHPPLLGKEMVDLVGLTGYPYALNPEEYGLPSSTVAGLVAITQSGTGRSVINVWNLANNVSWFRNKHGFKFGFNLAMNSTTNFLVSPSNQFGSFTFDGFATGQPFGDFLLGIPRLASRAADVGAYYGSNRDWSFFFADDWKVTPKLTLNLGIRYERHNPFKEESDRLYNFDPKTGAVVVPDAETISKIHPLFPRDVPILTASQAGFAEETLVRTDKNDFAPRLSFALRTGLSDIVVRGGYGLFYNFESRKGFTQRVAGPFAATETFDNRIQTGLPLFQWPQAFPSESARSLGTVDINGALEPMTSSYVHQWNLSLEKEVGEYGLRLSYIGSSGIQLPFRRNINQPPPSTTPFNQNLRPYPYLRNITFFDQGATQAYNAFQAQIQRRFSGGFLFNTHYTWANNMTDSEDDSPLGSVIENAFDRGRERGRVGHNVKQRFISYLIWEVPLGKGRRWMENAHPLVDGILGAWSLSNNFGANSGSWYTPTFTGADTSNTNVITGRPDRICDGKLSSDQRSVDRWFDVPCFQRPAAGIGRFGNGGRAIIEGPGYWGTNLGLFKYFTIHEDFKFRLQANMMNLFNHPKFGGFIFRPDFNIVSPSAGRFSSTDSSHSVTDIAPARLIEVGIRMEW